ncbi:MAG: FG-GAP-like repeat-containing protein [Candidatus Cyclobacteriaceae bacterium M3_2C_046]
MEKKYNLILGLGLVLFLLTNPAKAQFNKITDSPIINFTSTSMGASWGDYNNDGYQDLIVVNGTNPDKLFLNNGDGTFTEISSNGFVAKNSASSSFAIWTDIDNDNDLDLYIGNDNLKQDFLYIYDAGTFSLSGVANFPFYSTTGGAIADFNQDSYPDIVSVHAGNNMRISHNTSGTFTASNLASYDNYGLSSCDYDMDGIPEIMISRLFETNVVLKYNGTDFTELNLGDLTATLYTYTTSWADYDNDGDFDILIGNYGIANQLFQNNGGTFTEVAAGDVSTDVNVTIGSSWGDYDNDGWLDLYISNDGAENNLYHNNGDGTFSKITTGEFVETSNYTTSCTWSDVNRDGYLDLYMTNYNSGTKNEFYQNTSSGNHWLEIGLTGTISNTTAVGAKVIVTATINGSPITQTRDISSQTGRFAQNSMVTHFGLGDAAIVETIRVEWPSGIIQELSNQAVDQYMEIVEMDVPAEPSGLVASATSDSQINLIWEDNATNEDNYYLERSVNDLSNFIEIATLPANATSYNDTGLNPGTTYYYQVRAGNGSGYSIYSIEANATTDATAAINAPIDFTANASTTNIDLTWTDQADNEDGFILERSLTSGSGFAQIASLGSNISSYSDISLNEGTTYFYQIKAYNATDESSYTSASASTLITILPPDNLAATASGVTQIDLSWNDNSANEAGFVIERATTSGGPFAEIVTTAADVISYSDMSLTEGTSYFYRIKAVSGASESVYTSEATATTWITINAPSGLSATAFSTSQIDLSWTDNADNELEFVIERAETSGGPFTQIASIAADNEAYSDTGLSEGLTYYYRVKAISGASESDFTSETSATTLTTIIAPDNLNATASGTGQIELTWDDNSDNESGFVIERSLTSISGFSELITTSANITAFSDNTSLAEGTTYFYRIKAVNGPSQSLYSSEASDQTWITINAPTHMIATAVSANQVDLSWQDNSDNEMEFIIERSEESGINFSPIGTTGAPDITGYTDNSGLVGDITYYYRVKAVNSPSESATSDEASATTLPNIIAPDGLIASALSHEQIQLSWNDNSDNETGFIIERSLDGVTYQVIAGDITPVAVSSFTDQGLTELTHYHYRVKAVNDTYESAYSNQENTTTLEYIPVRLSLPELNGSPGSEVVVPVYVENFSNILAIQLTLEWDASVLTLLNTELYGIASITDTHFNTNNPDYLTLSWDDQTLAGESLNDGDILFALRFQIQGLEGSFSPVFINAAGATGLEIADTNFQSLPVEVSPGQVNSLSMVQLSGVIRNVAGNPLSGVQVNLSGDESNARTTATDGAFAFDVLPGSNVTINPDKPTDNKANNGVTTLDIALIRRHILFSEIELNDFAQLAADVENSGSVSTLDIALIRRLILGKSSDFDGKLWKFVPNTNTYADPDNIFTYYENIALTANSSDNTLDFTGIRLGDVNNSWDQTIGRMKYEGEISLEIEDLNLQDEQVINIPVKASQFQQVSAFQFTLQWNADHLEFMEAEGLNGIHFSDHLAQKGYLTTIWDEPAGKSISLPDHSQIINLKFKVKRHNLNESAIKICSDITQGLAYNQDLKDLKIIAKNGRITTGLQPVDFKVYANYPNPFGTAGTNLVFEVSQSSTVNISIMNSIGQIVDQTTADYQPGKHNYLWQPNQAGPSLSPGIYFYKIQTGSHKQIGRMLYAPSN